VISISVRTKCGPEQKWAWRVCYKHYFYAHPTGFEPVNSAFGEAKSSEKAAVTLSVSGPTHQKKSASALRARAACSAPST
jgi:hypothetical protein